MERLCDLAVADLLVPLGDFLRAVGQIGCSPRAVERLAEGFRVSADVILPGGRRPEHLALAGTRRA